jgi:transposase
MAPAYAKPYVQRNKTDAREAEAICEAMQPQHALCGGESPTQQPVLALHRSRALLVGQRTMAANALRAALAEFGVGGAAGRLGACAN